MGVQRKRRRREEELEEERDQEQQEERPRERKDATPAAPADRALELQKTAGNRAVGAALSRWGMPWVPQTVAPQWPKEPQVIVDGTVIPMSSFSWSDPQGGTGTSLGKPRSDGEVSITTTIGDHSADLWRRTAEGREFKTVIIVMPHKNGTGVTITLTEATVSSYQVSGQTETWGLHFQKREFSQSPPQAQPRP
jgi:Type VI secretion system effector, Hcp